MPCPAMAHTRADPGSHGTRPVTPCRHCLGLRNRNNRPQLGPVILVTLGTLFLALAPVGEGTPAAAGGGGGRGPGPDPKLIGSVAKLELELGKALSALQQPSAQQLATQQLATQQLGTPQASTGGTQGAGAAAASAEAEGAQAETALGPAQRAQAHAEAERADPTGEGVRNARGGRGEGGAKGGGTAEGRAEDRGAERGVTKEGAIKEGGSEGEAMAEQTERSPPAAPNPAFSPVQLACPERPSVLYSAAKVRAAQDIRAGRQKGLLTWGPPEESPKYLVLFCNYGQMSNRMICVRNSIILAGLLNRTLVVDTLRQEYSKRHYSWPILLDTDHLKRCFGPRSVTTTEEYRKKQLQGQGQGRDKGRGRGRGRLRIDRVLCWAVTPEYDRGAEQVVVGTSCVRAGEACKGLDLAPFRWSFDMGDEAEGSQQKLCARSVPEVLEQYGKWDGERVIVAGDLAHFGFILPKEFTASITDIPFKRISGCPSPLAILPHPEIVNYAHRQARTFFPGQPFLALHLRRKDFLTDRCKKRHWVTACTPTDKVARCLAAEMNATGIPNLVICSDAKSRELDILEALVARDAGRGVPISMVVNPRLPVQPMGPLVGRSKEGHAAYQKLVMAQAAVFLGTDHSSFTGDVQRLRHGMGAASCRDRFICEGTEYKVATLDPFLSMLL